MTKTENKSVVVEESSKETTKETSKKNKVSNTFKGDFIVAVQVRGLVGVRKTVKDTLKLLGLTRVNQCVVLKNDPSIQGMLIKVKDYVTFGPVTKELITKLVAARGIEQHGRTGDSKGKYTYSCFEFSGKKYKRCFRLNPPRKGYGRAGIKRSFNMGGALGDRGEKISDLVERML